MDDLTCMSFNNFIFEMSFYVYFIIFFQVPRFVMDVFWRLDLHILESTEVS